MSVTLTTTTLDLISSGENSKTWSVNGTHTVRKPALVIQKRRTPSDVADTTIIHDSVKVVYGTEDASGDPMREKCALEVTARRPQGAKLTDLQAAVDLLQEIVAHPKFDGMVEDQTPLEV